MTDMLVRLYALPEMATAEDRLRTTGIRVKRALAGDATVITDFVAGHFGAAAPGWVDECRAATMRQPTRCFFAEREGELLGFACYDVTARGMFGPTGVATPVRGQGIGRALLLACLHAMAADGYAYGVIGWVHDEAFYRRAVGAIPIAGSEPGFYQRLLGR